MRFRLLAVHYIDDRLLEPGTEVGDGTSVPFRYPDGKMRLPSTEMEGVDEEGRAAVAAVQSRSFPLFTDLNATLPLDPNANVSDPMPGDPTAVVVDPTDAEQMAAIESAPGPDGALVIPEPKKKG